MSPFRRVSAAGRALIKAHEGLRLKAYPDPASGGDPWTIGYGHTKGVKPGDVITEAQADAFLAEDLAWVEAAINRLVSSPISQAQFDALASLIFNIGEGAFARSTLLRELNRHDHAAAAAQFSRWVRAAGKVMPGLVKRRAEEAAMFRAGMYVPAVQENAPTVPPDPSAPLVQPGPEPEDYHAPAGEAPDWVPPQPAKEKPMAPFIAAALPALIQAAPALIRVFGDSPQAERNAKAAEVVADIAMRSTGTDTAEGAVRAIETRPDAAAAYREAVHQSLPELLSLLSRATEIDEKTRASALDRNLQLGAATGGRWLWLLGAVVILVMLASYGITAAVLFRDGFTAETKALLLGQVVIFGFMTVLTWLFGSNIANRLSQQANLTKGQQQ